jgi:hypothetical protein
MGQVNRHRSAFTDSLDRSGGTVQPGQVILDGSAGISRPSNVSLERSARACQPGQVSQKSMQVSQDRSADRTVQPDRTAWTGQHESSARTGQMG